MHGARYALAILLAIGAGNAAIAAPQRFQAGAAKVDITPEAADLLPGDSVRDHLFVRAIVIANGSSCAVLVGTDLAGLATPIADRAIQRASAISGCVVRNVVISATHTHSGYTRGFGDPAAEPSDKRVEDAIASAVSQASKSIRPARVGYGTVNLDLNVNRDLLVDGRWLQGPNAAGPSDKTLAVLEFVGDDDRPIGVYFNYAMHPINFYLSGVISADVPGEATEYVERQFGGGTVAVFVQGASGDQNPALVRPLFSLVSQRTAAPDRGEMRLARPGPWVELSRERNGNAQLNAALASPVPADREQAYHEAIQVTGDLVRAEGTIMGEKIVDAMRFGITDLARDGQIGSVSTTFQCPGRDRLDVADPVREGTLPPYSDGAAVSIRQGMLRIGDVYIATVDGEVYSEIAAQLKQRVPQTKLMMTTLANGMANSGYIYSNNAGDHLTFQVIGSRLRPGCAEGKIISTGLEQLGRLKGAE
jgi:hypothetical protein